MDISRLVGSNNFYYCRYETQMLPYMQGLVGSNNFYYCRSVVSGEKDKDG